MRIRWRLLPGERPNKCDLLFHSWNLCHLYNKQNDEHMLRLLKLKFKRGRNMKFYVDHSRRCGFEAGSTWTPGLNPASKCICKPKKTSLQHTRSVAENHGNVLCCSTKQTLSLVLIKKIFIQKKLWPTYLFEQYTVKSQETKQLFNRNKVDKKLNEKKQITIKYKIWNINSPVNEQSPDIISYDDLISYNGLKALISCSKGLITSNHLSNL